MGMPKHRHYVGPGSPLFNQVVRNAPVLAPKHQALVCRSVRDVSLASMTGVPHHEDNAEREKESRVAGAGLHQPATDAATDHEKSWHLKNWAAILKIPKVSQLIDAAVQRWGRSNFLYWPAKIGITTWKKMRLARSRMVLAASAWR